MYVLHTKRRNVKNLRNHHMYVMDVVRKPIVLCQECFILPSMLMMSLVIKGEHKKTLIFPVVSGNHLHYHIPSVIFFVYSLKINLSLRYMVRVISTILSKGCEMQREVSTRLGAYPLILRRVRSFFVSVDTVS